MLWEMVWQLAVFLAFLVKGLTGFANTLVLSTILSFGEANRSITPVDLLLGLPANGYLTWHERKSISFKKALPLILTLLAGTLPGTLLLRWGGEEMIKLLLGGAVVALAVEMWLRGRRKNQGRPRKGMLLAIGLLSGLLCGLFGIGAFLVAYIERTAKDHRELRGTLCCVFLADNALRLVLYTVLGLFTGGVLLRTLTLLPAMALGLGCGLLLSRRVSGGAVRGAVVVLLGLMGVSLFAVNLAALV